jgi:nucleotide-binding universal stress UspA family protein
MAVIDKLAWLFELTRDIKLRFCLSKCARNMKTILCPIDFTIATDMVAKYAALLANQVHAKVVLVPAIVQETKLQMMQTLADSDEIADRLGELHEQITANYHIPCTVDQETLVGNIYKRLSLLADNYDMLMIGMKQQSEFTSDNSLSLDLLKLIHETLVPIYFVPEKIEFMPVTGITYAFDPKQEPNPPLLTLYWLADWFNVSVKFLSILPSNISLKERIRLTSAHHFVENEWNSTRAVNFETIVHDDVTTSLENHVWSGNQHDLLVLSINHTRITERNWQKSVLRRLLKNAKNPYLVIHR